MVGRRISAARATIWMTGRKTSGYGSFRLGKGLSNLTRTKHRPLFGQVPKNDNTHRYSPAGVFVPIRVDSLGSCWAGPHPLVDSLCDAGPSGSTPALCRRSTELCKA